MARTTGPGLPLPSTSRSTGNTQQELALPSTPGGTGNVWQPELSLPSTSRGTGNARPELPLPSTSRGAGNIQLELALPSTPGGIGNAWQPELSLPSTSRGTGNAWPELPLPSTSRGTGDSPTLPWEPVPKPKGRYRKRSPQEVAIRKQAPKRTGKKFPCPGESCGMGYQRRRDLLGHFREIHEGKKKPFPCNLGNCQHSFSRWPRLQEHVKNRHVKYRRAHDVPDLDKWLCPICAASFPGLAHLCEHMENVHSAVL